MSLGIVLWLGSAGCQSGKALLEDRTVDGLTPIEYVLTIDEPNYGELWGHSGQVGSVWGGMLALFECQADLAHLLASERVFGGI